jgi:Domain of unknown function (DUF4145)
MASTTCWNCGQLAHMTPIDGSASPVGSGKFAEKIMGCFRCDGCGAPNIAVATRIIKNQDPLTWLAGKKNAVWVPGRPKPPVYVKTFPDVPGGIAQAASDAHRCLAVSARAAVLMARSVIEAVAKDQGHAGGTLFEKIEAMGDLVRAQVRDGAHEVRLLGNDMAHGDFGQHVSPEDARLFLALMDEVLHDVYQGPAKVARAQAEREARKQRQAALQAQIEQGIQALPPGTAPPVLAVLQTLASQSGMNALPPAPSMGQRAIPSKTDDT